MLRQFVDHMKQEFDENYGFWLFQVLFFSVYLITWYALDPGLLKLVFLVFCTSVFWCSGRLAERFAGYRGLNKNKELWKVIK